MEAFVRSIIPLSRTLIILDQLDIEISNKKLFDFIMISPILRSHDNFKAIGWDKFNLLSKESYLPTYALGGVSSKGSDLASCMYNNGFGLAGISSI